MNKQTGRRMADEALILALACGATLDAAASKGQVSLTTVKRRLKEPGFRARIYEVRAEMVGRASAMLSAAAMEAVKTLLDLQKTGVNSNIRLGAARAVLEIGGRLRIETELLARLETTERALGLRQ